MIEMTKQLRTTFHTLFCLSINLCYNFIYENLKCILKHLNMFQFAYWGCPKMSNKVLYKLNQKQMYINFEGFQNSIANYTWYGSWFSVLCHNC